MKLPSRIRLTGKVSYEICYVDSFKDKDQLGECRPNEKQIVIRNGLSKRLTLKTAIHELLHALEFEFGVALSHKSIYELEDPLEAILRLNGWLPA